MGKKKKKGGIHIKKSEEGTFTTAANKNGSSVQGFANKVLNAPKGKYSAKMRKKANFARNFGGAAHRKALANKGK